MGDQAFQTGENRVEHTTRPSCRREKVLMDKAECAALLGIKKRTLEKYIASRRIPFIRLSQKLVRFHFDDVMAALRELQ